MERIVKLEGFPVIHGMSTRRLGNVALRNDPRALTRQRKFFKEFGLRLEEVNSRRIHLIPLVERRDVKIDEVLVAVFDENQKLEWVVRGKNKDLRIETEKC